MRILILNKSGQVWWIVHGPGFWIYAYYNKYISERDHLSTKPFSCSYNCEGLLPTELHNIRPTPLLWFLSPYTHKRALSSLGMNSVVMGGASASICLASTDGYQFEAIYSIGHTYIFSSFDEKRSPTQSISGYELSNSRHGTESVGNISYIIKVVLNSLPHLLGNNIQFLCPGWKEKKIWCRGIWRWI